MEVAAEDVPISEIEHKAVFPTVDEAAEYLKLSGLVNEVESLQYKDVFNDADTKGPISPHFLEKNSLGGRAMVITSESLKYVCIVFGCTCNAECWERHKRESFSREWGPPKGLPFGEGVKIHPATNDTVFSDDLYKNLYDALNVVIKDHPNYKIVVTGHGQGAAMSTVFATFLCHKKPVLRVHNINYGSPRIGGDGWKKWVNSFENIIVWRFVLGGDVIAGLPAMTMGYRHVGHTMHLDPKRSTKAYYYPSNEKENEYTAVLTKSPEFLTLSSELVDPIKDHTVEEYLVFLKERALKNPKKSYARNFDTVKEEKEESFLDNLLSLCS